MGRLHCGENLEWMQRLPDGCCDLIYADPPFDLKNAGRPSANRDDKATMSADGRIDNFLRFLRPRLDQMHRLLSERGSLYVHLNWRMVHYVKVVLDEIFGADQFLNEIIWRYRSGSRPAQWFVRKHETLLLYARHMGRHTFHRLREGTYRTLDLRRDEKGRPFKQTRNGRLYFDVQGPIVDDVWDIPFLSTVARERTGYPSQKPEALLERVIRASSNEGDVVADFFCGSGTTLAVAQRLNRQWLGCDRNPQAVAVARKRLDKRAGRQALRKSRWKSVR